MDNAAEPDPRIIAKEAGFGIGGPIDPRMKSYFPCDLFEITENRVEKRGFRYFETFVGIDVKDPVACRLLERKVACGGKVVAPSEMMKLNRKTSRFFDRVVLRARVDDNDLVGFADK